MAKGEIRKFIKSDLDIDIKLETITNQPNIQVPECCRELWESCEHILPKEEKREFNPI